MLTDGLVNAGFSQSNHDYSLFIMKEQDDIVIVLVYIDALLITRSNNTMIEKVKYVLNYKFKMKVLWELKCFLGIEILRDLRRVCY